MDKSDVSTDGESCVPNYALTGARCKERKSCNRDNCKTQFGCRTRDHPHGGNCIKGQSDVFVHCKIAESQNNGKWSDWKEIATCSSTDYFRQRFRTCQSTLPMSEQNNSPAFCPGPWLEVGPVRLRFMFFA